MTIKRLLTVLTIAATMTVAVNAADYAALRREADASQSSVMSPSAACNKGDGEAFSEFIVKFTVDQTFNAERSKISSMFGIKPIADYRALVVTGGHDAGYTQMWKDIKPDAITLECGFAGATADYHYLFRRQGGKWMLTDRKTPDF